MKIYTTLNKIRSFSPCQPGWQKLLKSLNKTQPDDEPIDYLTILASNGLQDTIWCMRCEWFENKATWMQFVDECVARAKSYANANANAYAAASAADAAYYAAYYAANAANAAAERQIQTKHLTSLLQ